MWTVHNPDIGRILPVYVADSYDGFDAKPYADLTEAELDHYIEANVAAVRDLPPPDAALANHLIMGPLILARALADRAPYAVKVHGSALEYTVRPNPRFLPYALEGIRSAPGVLVAHTTRPRASEVMAEEPDLPERTRLGPPGVDVHRFALVRGPERLAKSSSRAPRLLGAAKPGPPGGAPLDPEQDRTSASSESGSCQGSGPRWPPGPAWWPRCPTRASW